jgi:hypothetical protein
MTTEQRYSIMAAAIALALPWLGTTPAAQTRKVTPTPTPAFERPQTPASMGVHGFSVVLVVGYSQGTAANENVPEAARKALADMKDFLPYKRYQLLDAAWILCCTPDKSQVSGRVRGPDGRDYIYALDPGDIVGSKLNLRFVMWDAQESITAALNQGNISDTARLEVSRQLYDATRERDEAEIQVRSVKQKFEVGVATPTEMESANTRLRRAEQRVQDLQRFTSGARGSGQVSAGARSGGGRSSGSPRRELMATSFSISLNETVVIGTSRLNGDQALIALLTAAAKPGSNR